MIKTLNVFSNISYDVVNHLRKYGLKIQFIHGETKKRSSNIFFISSRTSRIASSYFVRWLWT